ncbi:hypothetical protein LTR78_000031 [Recurvomyces mirabilis]|uniref:Uncharacterized protein n=1 Tax=Recurvomyces mirabilis TaxID=574656 RepID=A0AAE1C678_9PEZI|nr:hypothetical protein LTR78_000031 [Recurvomyces mirabilis]KAK5161688.1 hypothetical protein LTS14_000032 [Recurvomyces mirabilis]
MSPSLSPVARRTRKGSVYTREGFQPPSKKSTQTRFPKHQPTAVTIQATTTLPTQRWRKSHASTVPPAARVTSSTVPSSREREWEVVEVEEVEAEVEDWIQA